MLLFLVAFATGMVLSGLCNLLELIPWRRSKEKHWAQRARLVQVARVGAAMNEWSIPLLVMFVGFLFVDTHRWPPLVLGAYAGGLVGGWPLCRALMPSLTPKEWLHLVAARVVFRTLNWGIWAAAINYMPGAWNIRTAVIGGIYIALQLGFTFGLNLKILRAIRLVTPASGRLHALVQETATNAGVSVRGIWELRSPQANALAFITTREVVFTSALIESAPEDELRAICLHELAHLTESRWIVLSRIITGMLFAPVIFIRPIVATWGDIGVQVMALIVVVAWFLRPMLTQALERRADRQTVQCIPDGATYGRALERIHRINHLPAVLRNKIVNTHQNLYDRMLAAKVTPDFPRPEPPAAYPMTASLILAVAVVGFLAWNAARR